MTKIKMCGLTRPEDIAVVNELKPEFVGFVFWEKSSRNLSRSQAAELKKALLPGIKAVGVFVDEDCDTVAGMLKDGIIDLAQLHGNESEEYIGKLRRLAPSKEIIKAFVVRSGQGDLSAEATIERARACSADYLLLDSGKGTGQTFNWELIRGAKFEKPVFLAGGLSPENVEAAVKAVKPYAVDVSSGIEAEGRKDPEKMREFVTEVRRDYD